jgi:hypothetical protein
MESIGIGAVVALIPIALTSAGISSAAYEFQALHSGQRPSHFVAWLPHSVQE